MNRLMIILGLAEVLRVIDGDTVKVRHGGEVITCRLIGVDTPETKHPLRREEHYGKEATVFLTNLLAGETVEIDGETSGTLKMDKYGRSLVYIHRGSMFVNEEIVRQGYGRAYTRFKFKYAAEFTEHERRARESKKGLWQ